MVRLKKNLLALDLASNTGWAFRPRTGKIRYGVWDLKESSHGHIFSNLYDRLNMLFDWPDFVVYEKPHHRGGAATDICVGLQAILLYFCHIYKIPVISVHSGTLKKHATGDGRATKIHIIAAANFSYGTKLTEKDHDIADALMLLDYAVKNEKEILHGK